uniref:BRICHOS domain-containing protein n=1 Tax=Naja naja TaxID=35670 RepID=A0A8C6Y162_NAJNA
MLTCGIICIMVAATVSFTQVSPKPLSQVMQLNFQNRPGSLMNQSVVVSKAKKTITYYITSSGNQTTAILFDCKNGYVCYKLSGHSSCYLKRMNAWDQDAAQASFNLSKHKEDPPLLPSHGSQYYREFLGVVPGSLVPPAEAGEAVRGLCKQMPIRWVKKKDGKLMGAAVPSPPSGISAPFQLQVKLSCNSPMPISRANAGVCWELLAATSVVQRLPSSLKAHCKEQ